MPDESIVSSHYANGQLLESIKQGVKKLGKTTENVDVNDLGPVDEFHIGGRIATKHFLDQLNIAQDQHFLDVGCGLGGGCRFAAQTYGSQITGVDLTAEYIETGKVLCEWVGLSDRIELTVGNATELPQAAGTFDGAYMLHVGMNIQDKPLLAREIHRVVKPGAKVGIYDVMRVDDGALQFPVPWATEPAGSAVEPAATYVSALESAGFTVISVQDRRDFALRFFKELKAKITAQGRPPPLGLHIVMGEQASQKVGNMVQNIANNLIAPFEIIAEKN